MNDIDIMWLEKCKEESRRYKIWVDNDEVFIVDLQSEDEYGDPLVTHTFAAWGYEFAWQLLEYIGCNVCLV